MNKVRSALYREGLVVFAVSGKNCDADTGFEKGGYEKRAAF